MNGNCRKWNSEIIERARRAPAPGATVDMLEEHLRTCEDCRGRWERQRALTSVLDNARVEAGHRPPRPPEFRRELLAEFDAAHARPRPALRWLAAAAVLLLAIALGYALRHESRQPSQTVATQAPALQASGEPAAEAASGDESDFVTLPYAPPLASGEFVSVVRTELQRSALARMGIYVDSSYGSEIQTDMVVGEDGVPRAVRILGAVEF